MDEKVKASIAAVDRFVAACHQLTVEEYRAIKHKRGEEWDAISRWGSLSVRSWAKILKARANNPDA